MARAPHADDRDEMVLERDINTAGTGRDKCGVIKRAMRIRYRSVIQPSGRQRQGKI